MIRTKLQGAILGSYQIFKYVAFDASSGESVGVESSAVV